VVAPSRKVALTIDLEEWTVPEDFGTSQVPENVRMHVSAKGLQRLLAVLSLENVKATFFVTAYFAQRSVSLLRELSKAGHEIGSHGLDHTRKLPELSQSRLEKVGKIRRSTRILEACTGTRIEGYREPYFAIERPTIEALIELGYLYDSSILGTLLPRKLEWITVPPTPFVWKTQTDKRGKLVELPISVFPKLRIPAGWWWFRKNLGDWIPCATGNALFRRGQPFITNIHAWELVEPPAAYPVPFHIRYNCGEKSGSQILSLISRLKQSGAEFVQMKEIARDSSWTRNVLA